MLLETWLDIELASQRSSGDSSQVDAVKAKLPIKVKKRRPLKQQKLDEDTHMAGADEQDANREEGVIVAEGEEVDQTRWEEYYDYVFPDDEKTGKGKSARHLKLLEVARKWKKEEAGAQ